MEELVLSSGKKVKVRPVSPFLLAKIQKVVRAEMESQGYRMEPPYYEVKTESGTVERYPHDDTTVTTEEERKQLAEYRQAQAEFEERLRDKYLRVVTLLGVDVGVSVDEMRQAYTAVGLMPPEDDIELRIQYVMDFVVGSPEDVARINQTIVRLSTQLADSEDVKTAVDLFRDKA